MQPLYFLPGLFRDQIITQDNRLCPDILRARGLAETFADVRAGEFIVTHVEGGGPNKQVGSVLAYHTTAGKLPELSGYNPHQQTWQMVSDYLWIGVANDHPPTPADLRRHRQYDGYAIDINGEKWQVPIVRRVDDSTELPRDCYFDHGKLVEPIKEAYRKYWEESKEVAHWFFAEGLEGSFTRARGLCLAVDALSLNYRFSMDEQNALHVIDVESLLAVLMASVDVPGARALEDAQKKTQ